MPSMDLSIPSDYFYSIRSFYCTKNKIGLLHEEAIKYNEKVYCF